MVRTFLITILAFQITSLAAAEVGERVAVKAFSKLVVSGKTVDEVGPGQILQVLNFDGNQLWVSRGQPGWIPQSSVLDLASAEQFFSQKFSTGAGAADYLARGNIRIALGKLELGVADLKRAVELANDKQLYLEALGYGMLAAHDPESAVQHFDQAMAYKGDLASALMGRGLAYYQMGQNDKAAIDFTKAIELKPAHAFPRKYYGALLHDTGQHERALAQLNTAIELDSYDLFTRKATARLFYDMHRYEDALKQFDIAVKLDRRDVEGISGRGVVLHAQGTDLVAAKQAFEAAIALTKADIESAYLWSNLGQVQMELQEYDAALKNLDKSIALDGLFAEARSHRAYLIAKQFAVDPNLLASVQADVRAAFKSSDARTYWDYRALAAVNAALHNIPRAIEAQVAAIKLSETTAPPRFKKEASDTLRQYQELQGK